MSPQLTNVSSRKAHKVLKRLGFADTHRAGSHQSMVRMDTSGRSDIIVLVMGMREINPYTLEGILKMGNIDLDDFMAAL